MLSKKMQDKGNGIIAKNLQVNENNLMAAGFLHDIGHGPFSHVLDFVMKKVNGKTHEELAENLINQLPSEIEDWGITKSSVIQLVKGEHANPFLGNIINGPIDVDKLDYLLRDAYHVGFRYSFDLSHFLRAYCVLGDEKEISKCILGLDSTKQAVVTAELFLVIWKSMYDLVYHAESSRVAEKMMEKAVLLCKDEDKIKNAFRINNFVEMDDENFLSLMRTTEANNKHLLAVKDPRKLYNKVTEFVLESEGNNLEMTTEFAEMMAQDHDELSEKLSLKLNGHLKEEKYTFICDIVRSKSPKEIYLNGAEDTQEIELRTRSDLIGAIKSVNVLKVYANPKMKDLKAKANETMKGLIEGEISID